MYASVLYLDKEMKGISIKSSIQNYDLLSVIVIATILIHA